MSSELDANFKSGVSESPSKTLDSVKEVEEEH